MSKNNLSSLDFIKSHEHLIKSNLILKRTLTARLECMSVLIASNDSEVFKSILNQLNSCNSNSQAQGSFEEVKETFQELDNFLINYLHKTRKRFINTLKMNLVSRSTH